MPSFANVVTAAVARKDLAQMLDSVTGEGGTDGAAVAPASSSAAGAGGAAAGTKPTKPTLTEAVCARLAKTVEMFRRLDVMMTGQVDRIDFRRTIAAVPPHPPPGAPPPPPPPTWASPPLRRARCVTRTTRWTNSSRASTTGLAASST